MSDERDLAVERRIREAIIGLRPLLRVDHPDTVDLVSFDAATGVAILRLDGGCPDCDMPVAALLQGIEAHLKLRVPEIREIRARPASSSASSASSS